MVHATAAGGAVEVPVSNNVIIDACEISSNVPLKGREGEEVKLKELAEEIVP
jgi:hypothetical protein